MAQSSFASLGIPIVGGKRRSSAQELIPISYWAENGSSGQPCFPCPIFRELLLPSFSQKSWGDRRESDLAE